MLLTELDKQQHQVSKDWIIANHGSTHSASREESLGKDPLNKNSKQGPRLAR